MPLAPPRDAPPLPPASAGRRAVLRGAALLTAGLLALAGCASTPPEAFLDAGYRTPLQTFRTFQLGMEADLPGLEFSCLSVEFLARHRLSELAYREFRDASGWLRYGVSRACVGEQVPLAPDRVRLGIRTSGPFGWFERRFDVDLVRESFFEAWAGPERVMDELLTDPAEVLDVVDGASGPVLTARLPLPYHLDPREGAASLTGVRVDQEWKIADIRRTDDAAAAPSPPSSSP